MQTTAPAAQASHIEPQPSGFFFVPRPACVADGKYANQRRFGPPCESHSPGFPEEFSKRGAELEVYRSARQDIAEVNISIGLRSAACVKVFLDPDDLRELAQRLIDAAHDIEAHPAESLKRSQQERQGGSA